MEEFARWLGTFVKEVPVNVRADGGSVLGAETLYAVTALRFTSCISARPDRP